MGGFFGAVSKTDCSTDIFFGTDYHSHLGTVRGGLAVKQGDTFKREIHDITNAQFRSKFDHDISRLSGKWGIGVISDFEDQPLIIGSHLGNYAIVTVGRINNSEELVGEIFKETNTHFSEMDGSQINPTEIVATIINRGNSFKEGLDLVQERIDGSCSILLLTEDGIYVARDGKGRTPIVIGRKESGYAATFETAALPNLGYDIDTWVGPGEIILMTEEGLEQKRPPNREMQICTFLWMYYGYPASSYENINVEEVRNRSGERLASHDDVRSDLVAGIPDSGTGHAIGYAVASQLPYRRPFVKYTPTWPRSFMPQDQQVRNLVASMKLIPIESLIRDKKLLFCEDSIVRGTQLKGIISRLFGFGAREIHMRVACPPLVYGCKFLNFSRSRSILDLAARKAIGHLEGENPTNLRKYTDPNTKEYSQMLDYIREQIGVSSLKYQKLDDVVEAVGLPQEKLCTYCWTGCEGPRTSA